MPTASALRAQIEAALADRIPSALSPAPRVVRPVAPTGIPNVDALLHGGLPLGAITEIVGPECSGRTSFALAFLPSVTQTGKVCAWVDVSNALDPESAAATGVDLTRLLWVRCGVTNTAANSAQNLARTGKDFALSEKYLIPPQTMKGLHGGGCGGHPRGEVKGLSDAVGGFLRPEPIAPQFAQPQRKAVNEKQSSENNLLQHTSNLSRKVISSTRKSPDSDNSRPLPRIAQALRVTDLLLQAGGFSAIVLDLGSIVPEYASRVPLATWFRYRAAAERSQASILLLTQHP